MIDAQDAAVCALTLGAFADGFRDGSLRGLRTALIPDAPSATVKVSQELQPRFSILQPRAQCFPSAMTIEQLGNVFVRFISANPSRRSEYYRAPLVDAVEAYFCP